MASDRIYGEIDGHPEGTTFPDREAAHKAGVHRPLQAGISGGKDGADSIVVSGGYPDDEDYGDEIIYTGQGGRDENTGRQVADQELTRGNIGLARSELDEREVRVIRGADGNPRYSPKIGYRYDGLFRVVDHWQDTSRDGPRIWRYRLVKVAPGGTPPATDLEQEEAETAASRSSFQGERIRRNPAIAKRVKEFHGYHCQICGIRLMTAAGPHAEGAHIRGLGRPHDGPDVESNMLCLCPNHHVLFDAGTIIVDDSWKVLDALSGEVIGPLRTTAVHKINSKYLRYHREHHGFQDSD